MHKRKLVMMFLSMLFGFMSILMFSNCVSAKTVSSQDFNVSVGDDNYAYALAQNTVHENENKQQLHFLVHLNQEVIPGDEDVYNYVWTHKFELYLGDTMILDETDVMPSKVDGSYEEDAEFSTRKTQRDVYFSKEGTLFVNYDIDPTNTYKIKFYNSFTCVDCPNEYAYKEQVLDVIELTVVIDVTAPTLNLDDLNDKIETTKFNNVSVNKVVNGTSFSVDIADDGAGIKEAYYIFSSIKYTYVSDLLEYEEEQAFESGDELVLWMDVSQYEDGYYLYETYSLFDGWIEVPTNFYAYFVIVDKCENYTTMFATVNLYFEANKNNVEYSGELPEEGTYKSIDLEVNPSYETYVILSDSPTLFLKDITMKYEGKTTLGSGENGEYYLHMYQKNSEGEILKLTRKYVFDSTAPSVVPTEHTNIPTVNKSYKSFSISIDFDDAFPVEGQYYYCSNEFVDVYCSGLSSMYYYLSNRELNDNENDLIDQPYTEMATLTFNDLNDGEYYLYFKVLDRVDNVAVYSYKYIIDNTAPIITYTDHNDSDVPSLAPHVVFEVDEKETSYKCVWFEDGLTPTYSQMTSNCNKGSDVTINITGEGRYRLWVYAKDAAGNETYAYSPVVLADRKGPNIVVTSEYSDEVYRYSNNIQFVITDGISSVDDTIKYGWYKENANVTANMLSNQISKDATINYPSGLYGTYYLYVSAKDELGNESLKKSDVKYYIDTDKIVLSLYGEDKITIIKNSKYEEFGAYAYKQSSKSIKVNVVVTGSVDTSKAGKYTITYTAGEGPLREVLTRTIIVEEVNQYYIITFVTFGTGIIASCIITFVRVKKEKSLDK